MKKLINLNYRKFLPLTLVLCGLILSGFVAFVLPEVIVKPVTQIETPRTETVLGVSVVPSVAPSVEPSPLPSHSVLAKPVASVKPLPSPLPSASVNPTPTAIPQTIIVYSNPVSTPTPAPSATPTPEPSPSSTPLSKVSVEIKQPDTTLNFEIEITDGINACALMQKAKDEGKINSLTIEDKYLESFGTLLIAEMNGYSNNWVFTVNSESPMGCSLVSLKNGDKIVWEYLSL